MIAADEERFKVVLEILAAPSYADRVPYDKVQTNPGDAMAAWLTLRERYWIDGPRGGGGIAPDIVLYQGDRLVGIVEVEDFGSVMCALTGLAPEGRRMQAAQWRDYSQRARRNGWAFFLAVPEDWAGREGERIAAEGIEDVVIVPYPGSSVPQPRDGPATWR